MAGRVRRTSPAHADYLHNRDGRQNSHETKCQEGILGALLERIDIHVEVPRVDYQKLSNDRLGEASEVIRARAEAARERQRQRFAASQKPKTDMMGVVCNADMHVAPLRAHRVLREGKLRRGGMGRR